MFIAKIILKLIRKYNICLNGNTNLEVTNLGASNLASFIICMQYMLPIGTSLGNIMKVVTILSGVKLGISLSLLGCLFVKIKVN